MRAIVTVVGSDRPGIVAEVSAVLYAANCNIIDLNQTVLKEFFAMVMLVDLTEANAGFSEIRDALGKKGEALGLEIRIQREEIFNSMHRI